VPLRSRPLPNWKTGKWAGSKAWPLNYMSCSGPFQSKFDLTGDFCTSGSEREFTLMERWYANEKIQAGADCDAAAAD